MHSALIVPCRLCPAASLAVRTKTAYVNLLRSFLRTPSNEGYVRALKSRLELQGIKTVVFDSKLPQHFVMCMWPSGRRKELASRAVGHEAMIVLGCDAAVETARSCAGGSRVVPGMAVEGIMNVLPRARFPFAMYLEVQSVARILQAERSPSNQSLPLPVANRPWHSGGFARNRFWWRANRLASWGRPDHPTGHVLALDRVPDSSRGLPLDCGPLYDIRPHGLRGSLSVRLLGPRDENGARQLTELPSSRFREWGCGS